MMETLRRKFGPLPLWAWLSLALAVGWFVMRRRSASSSSAGVAGEQLPAGTAAPSSSMGQATQAGSPADTGQATSDTLAALGAQNQSLTAALLQQEQDVIGLAQAQLSTLATQTALAPVDTSTGMGVESQPGGSNAPSFTFVFPNVHAGTSTTKAKSPAKSQPKTAAKTKTSPATTYSTYKRNVKTKPGQTVHFKAGKGYYAA